VKLLLSEIFGPPALLRRKLPVLLLLLLLRLTPPLTLAPIKPDAAIAFGEAEPGARDGGAPTQPKADR